jgi:hypothetical protein
MHGIPEATLTQNLGNEVVPGYFDEWDIPGPGVVEVEREQVHSLDPSKRPEATGQLSQQEARPRNGGFNQTY